MRFITLIIFIIIAVVVIFSLEFSPGGEFDLGTLGVDFQVQPNRGPAPLNVIISAEAKGTRAGMVNYLIWWNCDQAGVNIFELKKSIEQGGCGDPGHPEFGIDFTTPNRLVRVPHTFDQAGGYSPKIIINQPSSTPATDQALVLVR